LASVYRKRQREKTRLSSEFTKIFVDAAKEAGLAAQLNSSGAKIKAGFIASLKLVDTDRLANTGLTGELSVDMEHEDDLQRLLDMFVVSNLQPFYPETRSIGRVKDALYRFLKSELRLNYEIDQLGVFKAILGDDNPAAIARILDIAKERYIESIKVQNSQLESRLDWDMPQTINSPSTYVQVSAKKSAMQPFYYDQKWKTEEAFIEYLEKSNKVSWWFKNGERDATFFAVPYIEDGVEKPFYVDFVVKLQDGSLALFDTKSGQTIQTSKAKSDGLQKYLAGNKGIFGGIAANTSADFSGRWVYFIKLSDQIKNGDFSNWETLQL
jgi:hypothetical protein